MLRRIPLDGFWSGTPVLRNNVGKIAARTEPFTTQADVSDGARRLTEVPSQR